MATIPAETIHQQMMEDPAYRVAWEASEIPMMIAFTLCEARRRAGLTRAQVAIRVGASEKMVTRWERGTRAPDLAALHRYAKATGSRLQIELMNA